jgi:diadenosine tetraphosphate (Ap4A) HIT family hydrolase
MIRSVDRATRGASERKESLKMASERGDHATDPDCALCRGPAADADLFRTQTWEDDLWRLTTSLLAETPGFSYLEPKRHIEDITHLDGVEAETLGAVLARVTRALRTATASELVYVYVFGGGVPHLHVHLAPHVTGDALNQAIIKGELIEREHPSGVTIQESKSYPPLDEAELLATAARIRELLEQ